MSGNFAKNPFLFFTFLDDHLKTKTIFIGSFGLFHFFFSFFCFYFSNIKKEKTKNPTFFSKTSFLITQNFAKTLFWHTVTLFVFLKMPPKHYKLGKTAKKKLDQFLTYSLDQFLYTYNLDQFLSYKTPNLGPACNSSLYIYTHTWTLTHARSQQIPPNSSALMRGI